MYRDSQTLEEYILSVCLHNKTAIARCMSHLSSQKDFTGSNQKAFAVMEAEYQSEGRVDPLVLTEKWVALKIFSQSDSRFIFGAYDNDTDFEPKMRELARHGTFRQAQRDIVKINDLIKKNITPDKLSSQAMEFVSKWNLGGVKKYSTSEEVEERERLNITGEKLQQGIPLLDGILYRHAGQHKGTVKATIFREKHGKTRHACWEVAQDLRQGHKVLYVTLESQENDIKNNVKQVLQHEWDGLKGNLFYRDATTDVSEIISSIVEWVFIEDGDKVVIDHMQRIQHPDSRKMNENENGNKCCMMLTDAAVKYDLNMHLINQARQPEKFVSGYESAPKTYDCYGSNQLIKDASLILVGFRPNTDPKLVVTNPLGAKVQHPDEGEAPLHSVFLKPILSRKKMPYLHKWAHFVDTDEGFKLYKNELI